MTQTEIWADVNGYVGLYQVSNLGRVRSVDRIVAGNQKRYKGTRVVNRRGKMLKPGLGAKGYYHVVLCVDGIPKNYRVHRLVAETFIPNPQNKPAINHIDANPLNNHAANLEWCTIFENNRHTHNIGHYVPAGTYKKVAQTA